MMQNVEIYLAALAKFIGYLAVIYGFYRLIAQDWAKKRKERDDAKAKLDADSHKPIIDRLGEMESKLTDQIDEIRTVQMREKEINRMVAKLTLAMADELSSGGETNGRTREAVQELRQTLLDRA